MTFIPDAFRLLHSQIYLLGSLIFSESLNARHKQLNEDLSPLCHRKKVQVQCL